MVLLPFRLSGILGALLLFAGGCLGDAERSNPLDPFSPDFRAEGQVTGLITGYYAPFQPMGGVEVRLEPEGFVRRTDVAGRFVFDAIPEGRYRLVAMAEGFAAASDSVVVMPGRTATDTLRLDGLPDATLVLATVHLRRRWPPPFDQFRLEVTAETSDPDGVADVVAAWLDIPDLSFVDTLVAGSTPGQFVNAYAEASLPVSLHALMGRPVRLGLRDRAGIVNRTALQSLVRVIDATPVATAPILGVTLAETTPTLTWEAARLPYDFTYQVDLFRREGIDILERTIGQLAPDVTRLTLTTPLAPGEYGWTVSIIDAFGNRSRSNREGFFVE